MPSIEPEVKEHLKNIGIVLEGDQFKYMNKPLCYDPIGNEFSAFDPKVKTNIQINFFNDSVSNKLKGALEKNLTELYEALLNRIGIIDRHKRELEITVESKDIV